MVLPVKKSCLVWMLCALLILLPAAAMAEVITQVDLTVVIPKAHAIGGAISVQKADDGESRYTVTTSDTYWLAPDGSPVGTDHCFVSGNEYIALFTVDAASGHSFDSDKVTVLINYQPAEVVENNSNSNQIKVQFKTIPTFYSSIASLALTGVPTPVVGAIPTSYTKTWSNSGEGDPFCMATGTWQVYDYTSKTFKDMGSGSKFADGNIYRLSVAITAQPGYGLKDDFSVSTNADAAAHSTELIPGADPNYQYTYNLYFVLGGTISIIDSIEIPSSALPAAEVGKTIPTGIQSISLPNENRFTLQAQWLNLNGEPITDTESFQNNKAYYLRLILSPKAGYALPADHVSCFMADGPYILFLSRSPATADALLLQTFLPPIQKAELKNLPEPQLGKTLDPAFPVEVPSGAHYTANAEWYCWNDGENTWNSLPTDKAFSVQANTSYRLEIWLNAKDGYRFADPLELTAYGPSLLMTSGDTQCFYSREFSFYPQPAIEQIEILGAAAPMPGQTSADASSSLSVPANANYTIESSTWYTEEDESVTQFESGKNYRLEINLAPKPGYRFDSYVHAVVNHENLQLDHSEPTDARLSLRFSLKTKIPKADVELAPFEIGELSSASASVPQGAPYAAHVTWFVWNDQREGYQVFNGAFEAGKVYMRILELTAAPDHSFAPNASVCLNRIPVSPSDIKESDYGHSLMLRSFLHTGVTEIDEVFFELDEPADGTHSSFPARIRLVNGSSNEVSPPTYQEWIIGTPDFYLPFEGPLAADGSHGIHFNLHARPGYVFASDLTVVVNGKRLPANFFTNSDAKVLNVFYFLGMEGEPYVFAAPPQTGDASRPLLWVGLMAASLGAACTLLLIRRRRRMS